jgi:hypothetical protein
VLDRSFAETLRRFQWYAAVDATLPLKTL